ncbi:MAG: helix-turn-helix transcriptional regulator [Clostridia bacterium]|nr:helix-turn-helix transcriptional regulator [Clostridia bacterium]
MSFKDNLRRIRLEKRMTQEVLAEKLDVTFQAVSSWERGEYLPDTEKLLKLADVLDVSVSALLTSSHDCHGIPKK